MEKELVTSMKSLSGAIQMKFIRDRPDLTEKILNGKVRLILEIPE